VKLEEEVGDCGCDSSQHQGVGAGDGLRLESRPHAEEGDVCEQEGHPPAELDLGQGERHDEGGSEPGNDLRGVPLLARAQKAQAHVEDQDIGQDGLRLRRLVQDDRRREEGARGGEARDGLHIVPQRLNGPSRGDRDRERERRPRAEEIEEGVSGIDAHVEHADTRAGERRREAPEPSMLPLASGDQRRAADHAQHHPHGRREPTALRGVGEEEAGGHD
jgi:hypothetical protein